MRIISTILLIIVAASMTGCKDKVTKEEVDSSYDELVKKHGEEKVKGVLKKKDSSKMNGSQLMKYKKDIEEASKKLGAEK